MVEEFYKGMIEDMRAVQEKTCASYEGQLSDLRKTISELTAQISALALSGKVSAGKLYGRKSEKSSRLGKRRDDDDRNSGKDNFDGTAGSDSGADTEVPRNNPSSGDTVSAIRKRLLRTHPGSEVKVERIDYSKAAAYTDSPTYHRLEDYYKLPEGAYYVTRNGKIDKNFVKVILFTPAKVEEHIYETATVRFSNEEDIRTLDTITVDRPIAGCWMTDEELAKLESPPHGGVKKRSACLVHIRYLFVNALEENYDEAMWFIDRIGMVFANEHCFKEQNMTSAERYVARLKPGSTADLMRSIEDRLADYALSDDARCGELLKKAMRYARAEWPAMKRVLESGDVEVSNNISEQSVRKLKMNLRNAGNIGSESSAVDNAFMYSVIESCKHNEIDPGKYISYLLGKLKTAHEGEDLTTLLPCYCSL